MKPYVASQIRAPGHALPLLEWWDTNEQGYVWLISLHSDSYSDWNLLDIEKAYKKYKGTVF